MKIKKLSFNSINLIIVESKKLRNINRDMNLNVISTSIVLAVYKRELEEIFVWTMKTTYCKRKSSIHHKKAIQTHIIFLILQVRIVINGFNHKNSIKYFCWKTIINLPILFSLIFKKDHAFTRFFLRPENPKKLFQYCYQKPRSKLKHILCCWLKL